MRWMPNHVTARDPLSLALAASAKYLQAALLGLIV